MVNRRSFLAALCALPVIGKWMPRQSQVKDYGQVELTWKPWVPMTVCPEEGGGQIFVTFDNQGYTYSITDRDRLPFPTLAQYGNDYNGYLKAFADWDRRYQRNG